MHLMQCLPHYYRH